jgi:hypothetical protein
VIRNVQLAETEEKLWWKEGAAALVAVLGPKKGRLTEFPSAFAA